MLLCKTLGDAALMYARAVGPEESQRLAAEHEREIQSLLTRPDPEEARRRALEQAEAEGITFVKEALSATGYRASSRCKRVPGCCLGGAPHGPIWPAQWQHSPLEDNQAAWVGTETASERHCTIATRRATPASTSASSRGRSPPAWRLWARCSSSRPGRERARGRDDESEEESWFFGREASARERSL